MQPQNQGAEAVIPAAAVDFDQLLHRQVKRGFPRVMPQQGRRQRFLGAQVRLDGFEHGQVRVQAQFVKMFPHQVEAKTVERADVGGVKQRELFLRGQIFGLVPGNFLERAPQALAHFRRGGFREGHHQDFVQGRAVFAQAGQAALNERVGFARARARHHQHIAARRHRRRLRRRQWTQRTGRIQGRFHAAPTA